VILRKSPYIWLVAAACFWGGNFVVGHELVNHIPPFTLAFLRWLTALIIIIPMFGRSVWKQRMLYVRHWKTVLFLAVTGVAAFNTLVYIAVQYTTPINASLMNAATPIIIVLLSSVILHERLTALSMVGIFVSLCGVLWIISHGSWHILVGLSFNHGDLWMVLAVIFWGLYSIAVKKTSGIFPGDGVFLVTVMIAVLILLPLSAMEWLNGNKPHHVTWLDISGVLYIGIFASIVSFKCWNYAVSKIGPSRSASYLNLIPLFSAVFAILFAQQMIHWYHGVGAVLIIGGVYVTSKAKQRVNAA
jgi:drug/metabolite transporter (DMT)-like permease